MEYIPYYLKNNCIVLPRWKCKLTLQFGQTKPLIFSMIPRTGIPVFWQKVASRLTSPTEMAYQNKKKVLLEIL